MIDWTRLAAAVTMFVLIAVGGTAMVLAQDSTGNTGTDPNAPTTEPTTVPIESVDPIEVELTDETGEMEPSRSLNRLKSDREAMSAYRPGQPLRLRVVYNLTYIEEQADDSLKKTHYAPFELVENFDLQTGAGVTSPITGVFKARNSRWVTFLDPSMLWTVEPLVVADLERKGFVFVRCDPRLGYEKDIVCVMAEPNALDELLARARGNGPVFQASWEWIFPEEK